MAKLSKNQRRNHHAAVELLEQESLSFEDKEFVFKHWHEGANHSNGDAGAFFTPLGLAWDMALDVLGQLPGSDYSQFHVVDLCAGIGVLSFCLKHRYPGIRITAIDANPDYVEVGKKLLPDVDWHCMSVTDVEGLKTLGSFDAAISNPPFGKVRTIKNPGNLKYSGGEAEYIVMEVAAMLAPNATFLVPQDSAGFRYSGAKAYGDTETKKLNKFIKETAIELSMGLSIDTTYYGSFKDVSVTTEVVDIDCLEYQESMLQEEIEPEEQLGLFDSIAA